LKYILDEWPAFGGIAEDAGGGMRGVGELRNCGEAEEAGVWLEYGEGYGLA